MAKKKDITEKDSELRSQAVKKIARSPEKPESLSPEKVQQTLHELRVHQIELEMQNEELRTSQEELNTALANYSDLYNFAPVGYLTISEKGLILEANLTATKMLGVPRSLLIRLPFSQFIRKEDQDIYYLHKRQIFATKETLHLELRMVKKDGTLFWGSLSATFAQAPDGAPVCRMVLRDITERKQTEGEVLFLSSITKNISDAITVTDLSFGIVYMNKSAEQLFGYTLDEVKGKMPDIFNVEPMAKLTQDNIYKTVSSGNLYVGESLNRKKDGTTFYCEYKVMPLVDDNSEILAYVAIQRNITDRKQMENELKKNQELSNALFEYNPIETIVVDREGRIVTFNLIKRNSGNKLPQIGSVMYKDYASKHECDMHAELMTCMSTGEIREFPELKYADKFLSIKIAPFPDGAIITAIDITEQKKAEDLLGAAYRELELAHNRLLAARQSERLAFTGRIAASIAHEIRNPSTNISLSLDQLSKTSKLNEKQIKYFGIIDKNISRINSLITEMLNCARPPTLTVKPQNIHKILDAVIESAALKMTTMKIKLVKNFTMPDPVLKVDKEQIGRVFLNLIINAIDAMSKKGGILTVATEDRGEYLQISIGDTGKGISKENITKIFDPFFTTKTSGIGLGLTTCYGVVVNHGGIIKVSSELSKGTVFTVSLPM